MTPDEIRAAAWKELLNGAESIAEDWIDEDGDYSEPDADAIYATQGRMLDALRKHAPPQVEVTP